MPLANKTKSEQIMSGLTEALVRERLQRGTLPQKARDKVFVREAKDIGEMKKAMKDVAKYLKGQEGATGLLKGRGIPPELRAQIASYKQVVNALQKGGSLNGKSMVDLLRREHKLLSDIWRAAKNDPQLKTRLQASGLRMTSAREGEIRQFTDALGATIADFNRGLVDNFARVVTSPKVAGKRVGGKVEGVGLAGAPVTVQSRLVEPVVGAVQTSQLYLGDRLELIHQAIQAGTRDSNENSKRDRFERWKLALKGVKQKGSDLFSGLMGFGKNFFGGLLDKFKWLLGAGGLGALMAKWFGGKGGFWSGLGTAIKSGLGKAWAPVKGVFEKVGTKLGALVSKLTPEKLKTVVKNVATNAKGLAGKVGAKAAGVGAAALGAAKVAGKAAGFGLKMIPGLGFALDSFFDFKKGQKAGKSGWGLMGSTLFGDTGKGKKAKISDVLMHSGGQALKWGTLGMVLGGPLGAAVGATLGGGIALIKDGLETEFLQKQVWPLVKGAGKVVVALWKDVTKGIQVHWNRFTGFLGKTIKDTWDKVYRAITDAVRPVTNAISQTWNRFAATVGGVLGGLVDWIGSKISSVVEGAKAGVKATKDTLGNLAGKVGEIFTVIKEKVGGAVSTVWNAISDFNIAEVFGKGVDAVKALTGKIGAFLQELFSLNGPIATAIGNAVQGGLGFLGNIFGIGGKGKTAPTNAGTAPAPARVTATGAAQTVNYSPKQIDESLKVSQMQAQAEMANANARLLEAILKDRKGAKEMGITDKNVKDLITQMFDTTKAHPAFAPVQ